MGALKAQFVNRVVEWNCLQVFMSIRIFSLIPLQTGIISFATEKIYFDDSIFQSFAFSSGTWDDEKAAVNLWERE